MGTHTISYSRVLIPPSLIQVSTLPCRKQYTVGVLMYSNSPFLFFLRIPKALSIAQGQMAGEGLYSCSRGDEGKVKM